MSDADTPAFDDFAQWLDSPLGLALQSVEQRYCDRVLANIFGYHAVQLELPRLPLLRANRMPRRWVAGQGEGCAVRCALDRLPFPAASLDLLVLPHTLDFHPAPHDVLREAERTLVPGGRLVLTGFNPWSAWGAVRLARRWRGMPWQGRFVGPARVRDWLALLGFEPVDAGIEGYLPPSQRALGARLVRPDEDGLRWPLCGALYCLEAVKRVQGMRLIGPAWRDRPALAGAVISRPAKRGTMVLDAPSPSFVEPLR
jgi:SAM-dependent methyltransferase